MPTARPLRRLVAPLLVVAGAALFGIGAGGIARVDTQLEAATPPAPPAIDDHRDARGDGPRPHRGEF